jgi:putative ABC transport system permease protein
MRVADWLGLSIRAVTAHPLRSALTSLGIAVGIAAVVLLTSIGEGVHRFVISEFTQFGAHIIGINPGRTTTGGAQLGVLGSVQPLTVEDALALETVPRVRAVVPVVQGNAEVEYEGRRRRSTVVGVGHRLLEVFSLQLRSGQFLPADDPTAPRTLAVLGTKVAQELFPGASPLGERIRIGGQRYMVVGVMAPKGQVVGFDMDDTVFIPATRALELFNREGLVEINVRYEEGGAVEEVVAHITRVLAARHGTEDFTVTPQQQMLDVLGSVLSVLTLSVAALGGVSLLVGAVGILTIMTIAVAERTAEIGLLRALGGSRLRIAGLLLMESAMLSAGGGIAGIVAGAGGAMLLGWALPALPVRIAWDYVIAAEVIAVTIGVLSAVIPAYRAAQLDPVEALRSE